MIQIGIRKRLFLITGKLIPGHGRHFFHDIRQNSSHQQNFQMDPNLELPDEMWSLIMEKVEDPVDKKSLENSSSRLQSLFRNENAKWLFPLALPVLMKYLKNEGILNCRSVSSISYKAIDKYIDKMFSESDVDEINFEYLKPLKLYERFDCMHTLHEYLNEAPRPSSPRTPLMTRFVSISPLCLEMEPDDRIGITEVRRIFTFFEGNIKGVEIDLQGEFTLRDFKEIFEIVFLQAPKLEKLIIGFDPPGLIVGEENENLLILDSPPLKLKFLNLIEPTTHLASYISFRRVFTQAGYFEGGSDLLLLSKDDLGALENVETIVMWPFNVNPREGRQRLYQGLTWLYAPKLRKIEFQFLNEGSTNEVLQNFEIWQMVKKRLLAIIRHKYRNQRTCRVTLGNDDPDWGEVFTIFLD